MFIIPYIIDMGICVPVNPAYVQSIMKQIFQKPI